MAADPDYVLTNRAHWDKWAHTWVGPGERRWASTEVCWGEWEVPNAEVPLLPDDMAGMRAVELGCGTGYVSAWMARRGAQVVGIDSSERQLATARRLAAEHGVDIDLRFGNAEHVPFPDGSFDFAISEYGVAIWADPLVWVPEAHRVLRPGGELALLGNSSLAAICVPRDADARAGRELRYPYFDLHRIDWDDGADQGVEFNLPISAWFRLFDETGFDVLGFYEPRPADPERGAGHFASAEWAHPFPSEQAWRVRKR